MGERLTLACGHICRAFEDMIDGFGLFDRAYLKFNFFGGAFGGGFAFLDPAIIEVNARVAFEMKYTSRNTAVSERSVICITFIIVRTGEYRFIKIAHNEVRTKEIGVTKVNQFAFCSNKCTIVKNCLPHVACINGGSIEMTVSECSIIKRATDEGCITQVSSEKIDSTKVAIRKIRGKSYIGFEIFPIHACSPKGNKCVYRFLDIVVVVLGATICTYHCSYRTLLANEAAQEGLNNHVGFFRVGQRKFFQRENAGDPNRERRIVEHLNAILEALDLLAAKRDLPLFVRVVDLQCGVLCLPVRSPGSPCAKEKRGEGKDRKNQVPANFGSIEYAVTSAPIFPAPFEIRQQQSCDAHDSRAEKTAPHQSGAGREIILLPLGRLVWLRHDSVRHRYGNRSRRTEASGHYQKVSAQFAREGLELPDIRVSGEPSQVGVSCEFYGKHAGAA